MAGVIVKSMTCDQGSKNLRTFHVDGRLSRIQGTERQCLNGSAVSTQLTRDACMLSTLRPLCAVQNCNCALLRTKLRVRWLGIIWHFMRVRAACTVNSPDNESNFNFSKTYWDFCDPITYGGQMRRPEKVHQKLHFNRLVTSYFDPLSLDRASAQKHT